MKEEQQATGCLPIQLPSSPPPATGLYTQGLLVGGLWGPGDDMARGGVEASAGQGLHGAGGGGLCGPGGSGSAWAGKGGGGDLPNSWCIVAI